MENTASSSKYNNKRRNILIEIDKGHVVNNLELGMYDLTYYYDNEKFDIPLYDKLLHIQNEKRLITHINEKKVYFMPKQYEALMEIYDEERLIISAPTSFGKTMILKEFIFREKPDVVVFIVPTNALAYELENSFKKNKLFRDYSAFDKNKTSVDKRNNDEKLLFIGTQEKYLEIKDSIDRIDLFVIDEAYKLEETVKEERAYKLSETFLSSVTMKCNKICLLSPNAKFEGFEKYNFCIFETTFNAVDKEFHQLNEDEFYPVLNKVAEKEKTILYCSTPKEIIELYDKLNVLNKDNSKFLNILIQEFHPEWTVIKLLKKGILCHHGQMPKFVQNRMINNFLYNENYNLLIGTNSISEGINTPTKNIFISPLCDINRNALLFKNTIGRAGRLGIFPIGHIYSDKDVSNLCNDEITIRLSIDDEEEMKELEEAKDETKKMSLCEKYVIEPDFYDNVINSYNISYTRFKKILDVLKTDRKYSSIDNLPFMAGEVKKDYYDKFNDAIFIVCALNSFYKNANGDKISLASYTNKIECFRYKKKKSQNLTDSDIIDGYMKFIYSTLDHTICPIVNIGKDLMEKYPKWPFGKNVKEIINDFNKKYYSVLYGIANLEDYSDNEKKILMTLREYGINIKELVNREMLKEIEESLNIRFSTYDIVNAIKKLAINSNKYKNSFNEIIEKYFGEY